jgi:allantoinase
MLSIPYSVELNDLMLSAVGITGPEFVQIVKGQYEQLHADAASGGRVMALALHPFVTGQAFRAKYFDQAVEFLAAMSVLRSVRVARPCIPSREDGAG